MSNVRRLARDFHYDISSTGVDGTWLSMPGSVDTNLTFAPNKVDATDYDGGGFGAQEITLQNGTLVSKYNSLINAGVPNPSQQLVEDCEGQFGDNIRLWVRAYDKDGGARGWKFQAIVEIAAASTGVADLRAITATFTMDGDTVTKMTSSDIAAAIASTDVPVLLSALPSGAATGAQVTITGQGFKAGGVDASSVKFAAVSATVFTVVSDSSIVAVVPSGSAGSAPITVTNTNGTSSALAYTRAA